MTSTDPMIRHDGTNPASLLRRRRVTALESLLFYFSLLVISAILAIMVNFPDWDLWARLAVGSIFFQTGGVLKHDIFAYTPTKPYWVDHEWGSGAVFFFIVNHFGETGLFVFKGILIFAVLMFIVQTIKLHNQRTATVGILYFVFLGLGLIYSVNHTIRSQLFTLVFFTSWIYLLERMRRQDQRLAWVLPATMVLWVNMHGGFLAGLGLIVIFGTGEFLNRKNPLIYAGILAGALLATLVNPYGVRLWPFIIEAIRQPRPQVLEWEPFSFSGPFNGVLGIQYHAHIAFIVFAIILILAGLRMVIARDKPDWVKVLLICMTFYVGLKHQRHTIFFVLASAGLLYDQHAVLFGRLFSFLETTSRVRLFAVLNIVEQALSVVIISWLVVILSLDLSAKRARLIIDPRLYPVGSFAFIQQNQLTGNLAVTYNWGSYALWKLYPRCRVMIDGRFEEVYSYQVFLLALDYSHHQTPNWPRIVQYFPADIVVLPKASYSPFDLSALSGWKMVYADDISMVLLPNNRIRPDYIYPDYPDNRLLRDDFARHVDLSRL